jgi:transposase
MNSPRRHGSGSLPCFRHRNPRRPAQLFAPRILNGILWIRWMLATGAPWRDLPAQYGSWHTVSSRFYRWWHAGGMRASGHASWQRCNAARISMASWAGPCTSSIARPCARTNTPLAPEEVKRAKPWGGALGRNRGGFSTKIHVRTDRHGKPLVLLVPAGECHDQTMFAPLLEQGAIKREGRDQAGRARSSGKGAGVPASGQGA